MEYYSSIKRNAFELVLMRWMNLEPIMQSEVSQKEKEKYHILKHVYGIYNNDTEEFIYRVAIGAIYGGGNGIPFQLSCLGNPMNRGAWRAIVHGVINSWTRLSD